MCNQTQFHLCKKNGCIYSQSIDYLRPHTEHLAKTDNSKIGILSTQQANCLYYLVKGMTMKQIGEQLSLSPRTVEHYLDAVKGKLNCVTRVELITKALQIFKLI